jgi:hypothetical protein
MKTRPARLASKIACSNKLAAYTSVVGMVDHRSSFGKVIGMMIAAIAIARRLATPIALLLPEEDSPNAYNAYNANILISLEFWLPRLISFRIRQKIKGGI